jgi:hypothetical protein
LEYLLLALLGLFLGGYGTMIGAGGGFILVPVLLWAYPDLPPEIITSISLAVVAVNSWSGVLAYWRMGRIDYKAGLLFAAFAIPGAMLGAYSTAFVSRSAFDGIFGATLIGSAMMLFHRTMTRQPEGGVDKNGKRTLSSYIFPQGPQRLNQLKSRRFRVALVMVFVIGYLSSMLGIGGGIFQVPILAYGLNFPVHAAVATSEFVLAIKAVAATGVHVANGNVFAGLDKIVVLAISVFVGAQVGARLSGRVRGEWIIQILAVSLAVIGLRFLLAAM